MLNWQQLAIALLPPDRREVKAKQFDLADERLCALAGWEDPLRGDAVVKGEVRLHIVQGEVLYSGLSGDPVAAVPSEQIARIGSRIQPCRHITLKHLLVSHWLQLHTG